MKLFLSLLLATLSTTLASAGATNAVAPAKDTAHSQNRTRAATQDTQYRAAFGHDPSKMLRPGLIADRTARTVQISAETIRLNPGDPVEFPLIATTSGKDYEALAISFAAPSDIHAALEFIGLPPGKTVSPDAMRFWPRGEPVTMTFTYDDLIGSSNITRTVSVAQLIIDTRTGKTIPDEGFLFTGSEWDPAAGTGRVYAADVYTPNCIASLYNERFTVLDVPRRVAQSEVYTFLVPNPDLRLPATTFTTVTLEPRHKDGHRRVTDLTLRLGSSTNMPLPETAMPWTISMGSSVEQGTGLDPLASSLTRLTAAGNDLYATIEPDDLLPLATIRRLALFVSSLESRALLRVEPPPSGHPYYKTFLPDEKHRDRAKRPAQPWELYLTDSGTGVTGELVHVEEEWSDDGSPSTYKETRHAAPGPDVLPALLLKHEAPAVVFVFTTPGLPYGVLRRFVAPLLERKMILYVFADGPRQP